jgi:Uncharacterized conserved protein
MLIVHADVFAKPGNGDEIAAIAQALITATQAEEGCHFYNLLRDTTDANHFKFVEGWESRDALSAHVKTDHFKEIFPKITELSEKPADVKSYEVN